jgi:hypothetical protein
MTHATAAATEMAAVMYTGRPDAPLLDATDAGRDVRASVDPAVAVVVFLVVVVTGIHSPPTRECVATHSPHLPVVSNAYGCLHLVHAATHVSHLGSVHPHTPPGKSGESTHALQTLACLQDEHLGTVHGTHVAFESVVSVSVNPGSQLVHETWPSCCVHVAHPVSRVEHL